jgi:glutamate synthase (NADPH/NADH) large chain
MFVYVYIYQKKVNKKTIKKTFVDKMNQELIEPVRVDTDDTERERLYLKRLLLDYLHETDSEITEYILQNFRAEIRNFWMVKPKNMTVLPLDPDKGD